MDSIKTSDGLNLHVRTWEAPPQYQGQEKGTILFVHGFGEHIHRYNHVADFFNAAGFRCVGYDHRGHGRSEGKRGHAPTVEQYFDDLELVVNQVVTNFGKNNLIVWGHSMGGNITLNYLTRRRPDVVRLCVVTGAWIRLAFEPSKVITTLGKMMRSIYPSFSQDSKLASEHLCTDPRVVNAYVADPLVHSQITASAGMGLQDSAAFLNQFDGEMAMPLLMMHGASDKIISPEAALEFARRVGGDIDFKMWQGLYHEIHNEPSQREIFQFALGWIEAKL